MCVAVFIPNCKVNDLSVLVDIGCAGLFDRFAPAMIADQFEGPGGQHGKIIYSATGAMPLSAFNQDHQEWLDCGAYWIGVWKNRKPTPQLLAREPLIDGMPIILADNNPWIVPISIYFPNRLTVDRATGEETTMPAPEHEEHLRQCDELLMHFISDEFQEQVALERIVRIPGGLRFAANTLAKNYRVNLDLVDLLGLVDEFAAFEIAQIATGHALAEKLEAQKKTGHLAGATS